MESEKGKKVFRNKEKVDFSLVSEFRKLQQSKKSESEAKRLVNRSNEMKFKELENLLKKKREEDDFQNQLKENLTSREKRIIKKKKDKDKEDKIRRLEKDRYLQESNLKKFTKEIKTSVDDFYTNETHGLLLDDDSSNSSKSERKNKTRLKKSNNQNFVNFDISDNSRSNSVSLIKTENNFANLDSESNESNESVSLVSSQKDADSFVSFDEHKANANSINSSAKVSFFTFKNQIKNKQEEINTDLIFQNSLENLSEESLNSIKREYSSLLSDNEEAKEVFVNQMEVLGNSSISSEKEKEEYTDSEILKEKNNLKIINAEILKHKKEDIEKVEKKIQEIKQNSNGASFKITKYNENIYFKVYYSKGDSQHQIIHGLVEEVTNDKTERTRYKNIKNNQKSIGFVVYLNSYNYSSDTKINELLHIPFSSSEVSFYPEVFEKIMTSKYKLPVKQIICGHEHGDKMNECHLQCCAEFDGLLTQIFPPGRIEFKVRDMEWSLVFIQQRARTKWLPKYCMKKEDFTMLHYEEEKTGYEEIIEQSLKGELTRDQALKILMKKNPTDFFRCHANIMRALDDLVNNALPKFEWVPIPEHLKSYPIKDGEKKSYFYYVFTDWFKKYCSDDSPDRKKALCLYSKKRAIGKTYFVQHLVNDVRYILKFSNTFTGYNQLIEYKLLLLDDMKPINSNVLQTWKSLVASEDTTLRDAFVNVKYVRKLPCIITTNNDLTVYRLLEDSSFNTQVIVIELKYFMGKADQIRKDLMEKKSFVSSKTKKRLNEVVENLKKKKEENKDRRFIEEFDPFWD